MIRLFVIIPRPSLTRTFFLTISPVWKSILVDGWAGCEVCGAIDLAFREPDKLVIVDYKTDKIDGNLDALIAYY